MITMTISMILRFLTTKIFSNAEFTVLDLKRTERMLLLWRRRRRRTIDLGLDYAGYGGRRNHLKAGVGIIGTAVVNVVLMITMAIYNTRVVRVTVQIIG
jgi:hypothetical protein